jgi:hypothetical protein
MAAVKTENNQDELADVVRRVFAIAELLVSTPDEESTDVIGLPDESAAGTFEWRASQKSSDQSPDV